MGDPFLDRLDESYAPGWKPEPGDVIDGIVTEISSRDAGWGDYPIWTVRRIVNGQVTDERVAIHATGVATQNKGAERGVRRGGRLAMRYNGKVTAKKGGNTYHDFDLVFDDEPDPALLAAAGTRAASAAAPVPQPVPSSPPAVPPPSSDPRAPWDDNEEPF